MTTIVYRSGVLAGDTRVTSGSTILPETYRKTFKLKDGSLYGASGDLEQGEVVRAHLEKHLAPPKFGEEKDIEAIHVRLDGSLWAFLGMLWVRVMTPYAAVGSGRDAALGALAMGASAHAAVKAAMAIDMYSGGKVTTVRLTKRKRCR